MKKISLLDLNQKMAWRAHLCIILTYFSFLPTPIVVGFFLSLFSHWVGIFISIPITYFLHPLFSLFFFFHLFICDSRIITVTYFPFFPTSLGMCLFLSLLSLSLRWNFPIYLHTLFIPSLFLMCMKDFLSSFSSVHR